MSVERVTFKVKNKTLVELTNSEDVLQTRVRSQNVFGLINQPIVGVGSRFLTSRVQLLSMADAMLIY